MYDIEIFYSSGDSFGSWDEHEPLGNPVSQLATAQENLRRIKEHYQTKRHSDYSSSSDKLELLTDDGVRHIMPFWMGYFEQLKGARIIVDADDVNSFDV